MGYTVPRTVYTPESDTLFPVAIDKLKRYIHYASHFKRFPMFGARCQVICIAHAEPNDEISRRFYLDIIEDKTNLKKLDGSDHFMALNDCLSEYA